MPMELKNDHKTPKRGDIFWYPYDDVILPCLVIQNDIGNEYSMNTIIVKMSSSEKIEEKYKRLPTIIKLGEKDIVKPKNSNLHSEGFVLASDIRTIKKNTLKHFIGSVTDEAWPKIHKGLCISLGIPKSL